MPISGKRGAVQCGKSGLLDHKVRLGLPLLLATRRMASLLNFSGPDRMVPDFSTMSRRRKALEGTLVSCGSKNAQHLPVDCTGIKRAIELSGAHADSAAPGAGSFATFSLELTEKHLRSALPGPFPVMSVTRRCCRNCAIRSTPSKRTPRSAHLEVNLHCRTPGKATCGRHPVCATVPRC
ncbi:transposase [Puniceibacterium confluentis]